MSDFKATAAMLRSTFKGINFGTALLHPIAKQRVVKLIDDHEELLDKQAALRKQLDAVKAELEQAYKCLEDYGDIDYDMLTQGGNQGLRHVSQAIDVLKKKEGEPS